MKPRHQHSSIARTPVHHYGSLAYLLQRSCIYAFWAPPLAVIPTTRRRLRISSRACDRATSWAAPQPHWPSRIHTRPAYPSPIKIHPARPSTSVPSSSGSMPGSLPPYAQADSGDMNLGMTPRRRSLRAWTLWQLFFSPRPPSSCKSSSQPADPPRAPTSSSRSYASRSRCHCGTPRSYAPPPPRSNVSTSATESVDELALGRSMPRPGAEVAGRAALAELATRQPAQRSPELSSPVLGSPGEDYSCHARRCYCLLVRACVVPCLRSCGCGSL